MGRVKAKLAVMLTDALRDAGYSVQPIKATDLIEATGWYRTCGTAANEALRWEGHVTRADLPKLRYWLTSFATMTEIVRDGVQVGKRDLGQIWIDKA